MRWFVAVIILTASSLFLYREYQALNNPRTVDTQPPIPAHLSLETPFLSVDALKGVRKSTTDGDPGVRWAAIELLYALKDPESLSIVEKTIAEDPDPELRIKAVQLLNDKAGGSRQLPGLIKGLTDIDTEVRLAAVKALGDIGDPAAAPWVAALLRDPENNVKTEALHTLGRFQDRRRQEFQQLTEQLRRQYETAVKKSQQNSQ